MFILILLLIVLLVALGVKSNKKWLRAFGLGLAFIVLGLCWLLLLSPAQIQLRSYVVQDQAYPLHGPRTFLEPGSGDGHGPEYPQIQLEAVNPLAQPTNDQPEADQPTTVEEVESTEPVVERPKWVETEPDRTVAGTFQMPIYVGPYTTRRECHEALTEKLHAATSDYAVIAIGPQARGRVDLPLAYLHEKIVQDQWEEWKEYEPPLGQMVKLHVLLEFDRDANTQLEEIWNRTVVRGRLVRVGAIGMLLLTLLSTAWAYLKIDLNTNGAYRGWLRLAVVTVVLAMVGIVARLG